MSDAADIDKLFQDIYDTLEGALKTLHQGGAIDSHLLQDKARYVCEVIGRLPADQAKAVEPKLKEISEHFSAISKELQAQQDVLKNDIGEVDNRSTARRAYRNAAALHTSDSANDK